jgi:nucleotide-binding universal stress UspA family protein
VNAGDPVPILQDLPRGGIVVGVDGSVHADRAIDWAARQAEVEGRHLVLVHSTHELVTGPTAALDRARVGRDEARRLLGSVAHAVLDIAALRVRSVRPGVAVHQLLVGEAASRSLVALSEDARLVVVGSRGLGPVRSALLGSVSAAVSARAGCPVVVVRPHHPGLVRRGVLVAAEGADTDLPVVEFAFRQASLHGLPVTVVRCSGEEPSATVPAQGAAAHDDRPDGVDDLLLAESVAGLSEKFPDVHVTLEVSPETLHQRLTREGRVMDLVVVGHRRAGPISRAVHGDAATAVLERAQTVVAVVPQDHRPSSDERPPPGRNS